MRVEKAEVTQDQREKMLEMQESHFYDVKSVDIKPAKLTETVSALANTSGGEIYVGIDENPQDLFKRRAWRGFLNMEAANAHLQVVEAMSPLGNHYEATFLQGKGMQGLVLQLSIFKAPIIINSSKDIPFVRRGAQNIPVDTPDAASRLKMDKGIDSFEDQKVDAEATDVTNSAKIIEFLLNVIPTAEPEAWLCKQRLVREGRPTVAGVLLFSDEPQAVLPKRSSVKIFRYKTREEGERETLAFDPIGVEGHLYGQIREAVRRTREIVEGIKKLGDKGLETVSYPPETLHEIITNAVLHRDYSIAVDVHIRIYDNRIEVESPGRLPGHVTEDNILGEQFARNPQIVRIINKFPNPPNKDVGEGLNTAFEAMRRLRLKEPLIKEKENSVIVYIKHEPLASPEEAVMEFLQDHAEIVNRVARGITGIRSENAMKTVFYRLQDKGLIQRVPGKKGSASAWRKKPT